MSHHLTPTLGLPAISIQVLIVLIGISAPASAQLCSLPGYPGSQPVPRRGHIMAYDSSGGVVLFGGRDAQGNYLNDTWRWNGTTWTLVSTNGPSARSEAAAATTSSPGWAHILLHGGITASGAVHDLWKWDGSTWTSLGGTNWDHAYTAGEFMSEVRGFYNGPPAHEANVLAGPGLLEYNPSGWLVPANGGANSAGYVDGAMCLDGAGRLIAFGGGGTDQTDVLTYVTNFLGKSTVFPVPRPAARNQHTMAFDGRGALLFGGSGGDSQTWRYGWAGDSTDWSVVATAGPGARKNAAMAYDKARNRVVLFGGEWDGIVYGDTWEWDGNTNTWAQMRCFCLDPTWTSIVTPAGLTARDNYAMAWDNLRDRVLVFGGTLAGGATTNELWAFNGTTWSLLANNGPSPRSNSSMAYDPAHDRLVLFGGLAGGTARQDTWEWDGFNWTQKAPPTIPPARLGHVMAMYPARGRITMVGGSPGGGGSYLSDTWEWDGTNWVLAGVAPARAFSSLTHDPVTQRLVMFGGQSSSGGAPLSSYALWDGVSWSQPGISGSAARPIGRLGAAFAFDIARRRPVLFGGRDSGATALSDMWELTGYGLFPWSSVTVATPTARTDLSMVYHEGSRAMVLFGGATSGLASLLNETWTLRADGPPWLTAISSGQIICEGSPVTLSTSWLTFGTTGYQWNRDGVPIPGATAASYSLVAALPSDQGSYTVTASNACGTTTSAPMSLTVRSAPHITAQPLGQAICPGGAVTFSVTATGYQPFIYIWRKNGVAIPSAPSAPTFSIDPVSPSDAGTYDVLIANSCSGATSTGAALVVACPTDEFRINAAGPLVAPGDSGPSWSLDTSINPCPWVNATAYGNSTITTFSIINITHASIPAGTPMSIFQSAREDLAGGAEMAWAFPTGPGQFHVRLYFAETSFGVTGPGQRLFNVRVEGQSALTDFDIFAETGGVNRGIVKTLSATVADGSLNIDFEHIAGKRHPVISGIEITREGPIRVNAGGTPLASSDGGPPWSIDTSSIPSPYANAGATNFTGATSSQIDMTDPSIPSGMPMELFQTERHDFAGGAEMSYSFPTGSGTHLVRLYFSEIFGGITGVGQRVFDVQAEGQTVLSDFDIFRAVGSNKAVARSFAVAVADSFLTLTFIHKVENPTVMAIEIVPNAGLRVNAGGSGLVALDSGPAWSVDTEGSPSPYVNAVATGNATGNTAATINLTDPSIPPGTPMSLFQDERWDPPGGPEMAWTFPTGSGTFQVRLYFAEIYTAITGPGQRVFHVNIEGQRVLENFDIWAQVGLNKGLVKTFNVTVHDGVLDIDFVHVVENPEIMAIQVVPNVVSDVPSASPLIPLLAQNSPNPFTASTLISFETRTAGNATLRVYDVSGRLVRRLIDGRLSSGTHRIEWDGRDDRGNLLPGGVYLYLLKSADARVQSRRMILMR